MALPTNGRVVVETTVGDVEIELWSKVQACPAYNWTATHILITGNAKGMPQFPCTIYGRYVPLLSTLR